MSDAVSKARISRAKRVTDLFEEGRELVLDDSNLDDPVLVWINKMNPFEQEDARKDGQVGRARALLRLEEPESAEGIMFEDALHGRNRDSIVEALVSASVNEDYVKALDDIRADEKWKPKVELLERFDEQMADAGTPLDDAEHVRAAKLNREYTTKLQEFLEANQQVRRDELSGLTDEEVTEAYRTAYRDQAASNGFLNEYRTTEIYFSVRDCVATANDNLGWDHTKCNHRTRLCGSRAEVRELPDELVTRVRNAITELAMSPKDAGNSDAPASSSASSERASAAAGSTPSTPTETSAEPDGTSSAP